METVDFELDLTDITTDLSIEVENLNGYVIGEGKMAKFIRREPFEITADEFAGVEEIPSYLFTRSSIEKVTIPSTIKKIGNYAFQNCTNLKEVILRDGLEEIGTYVFAGLNNLPHPTIPKSVKIIGANAFYEMRSTRPHLLIIPDGVENIGASAFADGTSYSDLRCVIIPKSVTTMGATLAGSSNTNMQYALFCEVAEKPSGWSSSFAGRCGVAYYGVTEWGITDDGLIWGAISETEAIIAGESEKNIVPKNLIIPSKIQGYTIKEIPAYMFAYYDDNDWLESVTFPSTITTIGKKAFYECRKLKTITMLSTTPPTIQSDTFDSTVTKIIVPKGYLDVYKSATNWSGKASKMVEAEE